MTARSETAAVGAPQRARRQETYLLRASKMNAASLALAERSAPRYTSYPTSPHFSKEIGDETMRAWLAALAPDATLSLYFHVPFCREICAFCGCHTKALRQDAPLTSYKETLLREIELVAGATKARRVVSIHWGGGTPGILGASRFHEISETIARHFSMERRDGTFDRARSARARRKSSSRRWRARASIAPVSACRISTRMCRKPPAACSPMSSSRNR